MVGLGKSVGPSVSTLITLTTARSVTMKSAKKDAKQLVDSTSIQMLHQKENFKRNLKTLNSLFHQPCLDVPSPGDS